MAQRNTPVSVACAVIVGFLYLTTPGYTAEDTFTGKNTDPPGEVILVDTFLVRPLSFAATIVGSVAFVVTLPVTLATKSVKKTARTLVVEPAEYTFTRPLGQFAPEPR